MTCSELQCSCSFSEAEAPDAAGRREPVFPERRAGQAVPRLRCALCIVVLGQATSSYHFPVSMIFLIAALPLP